MWELCCKTTWWFYSKKLSGCFARPGMWFKGMWGCLRMQNLLGKCYRSLQKQREPQLVWSCPYFLLGADTEANCLENCTVLLLTEQTYLLQKKAEIVHPVCLARGTECTERIIYQHIEKPSPWQVCRSFRQCVLSKTERVWNEKVKAASLNVIVFFFQAPTVNHICQTFSFILVNLCGFF